MTKRARVLVVTCGVWTMCGVWWTFDAFAVSRVRDTQAGHTSSSDAAESDEGASIGASLAGTWKSPEYRVERPNALDVEVFGPHAADVRTVDLDIRPTSEAVLKVFTSVVDRKGHKWAPAVLEATLRVGAREAAPGGRIQPAVTVIKAETRYLDGSGDQWPQDGTRVEIITEPPFVQLDVRVETPKGEGSFWTTMNREPRGSRSGRARPGGSTTRIQSPAADHR